MKILKSIIEFFLYLYIFLLPWQARIIWFQGRINEGPWEYGTMSFYFSEFILFILLLSSFVFIILTQEKEKGSKFNFFSLNLYLFAIIVLSFVSTFWAYNQSLAFYNFIKLLEGMGLLAILLKVPLRYKRVALSFVFSAFFQASLAFWQFLNQSVWGNKWLGMSSQYPYQGGVSVIEDYFGRWLRAYGTLPHPNILGGFLSIALLLLLGLFFVSRERRERILYLLFFPPLVSGLFVTFSRGSWLGFILALFYLSYLIFWKGQNQRLKTILGNFILIGLTIGALFSIFFKEQLFTRLQGRAPLEVRSEEERMIYFFQAKEIIKSNFLNKRYWYRGEGIGNYTLAIYKKIDSRLPSWRYQPVHNLFILIWAELGIIGFFIFLIFFYNIFRKIRKGRWVSQIEFIISLGKIKTQEIVLFSQKFDQWFIISSSILLFIGFVSLFDHYFWTLYFGVILFWLSLGLWLRNFKADPYSYL